MLKLLQYATLGLLVSGATSAHADFTIQSPGGTSAGPVFVNSSPSTNPKTSETAAPSGPIHWKMAYGFGNNVPLAFACKQIVPPAVKVIYGRGVDPSAPVTWKGGDTWNHILRNAITPLGWHLQMTHMAVEIDK